MMLLGNFWFGKHFQSQTMGLSSRICRAVTRLTAPVLLASDSVCY